MTSRAVVVLSGGQDSTLCLFMALRDYDEVRAVSFDYGQRHRLELQAAAEVAALVEVPHEVLQVGAFAQLRGGALTNPGQRVETTGGLGGLPSTFVPMRNLVFLTLAAARAVQWVEGLDHALQPRPVDVVAGVCETDFSGYPDCRRETMDALQAALSLGVGRPVRVVTPLMHLSKAESVRLGAKIPGCLDAWARTVTCYEGLRPGCGACPACVLRAKGFAEAGVLDPARDPSRT